MRSRLRNTAAARRRRGELAGGPEGRRLIEEADRWMLAQGVRNPVRMTAMVAPGTWRAVERQA